MTSLIVALRQDHTRMTRLLDALERQLAAFEEGGTLDFEIMDGIVDYCRTYPDAYHHPREDLLFDRLQQRDPQAVAALGDLRQEHDKLAQLMERFAVSLDAVQQDTPMERDDFTSIARAFLDAYRHHIMMEEKHFFPATLKRLTAEDWQKLQAQMTKVDDPLFAKCGDDRFKALYRDIVAWDQSLPADA